MSALEQHVGFCGAPPHESPAFYALVARAAATGEPAARMAILADAEKMMLADLPVIPIYYYTSQHMISPKLKGWEFNVLDMHLGRWLSKAE